MSISAATGSSLLSSFVAAAGAARRALHKARYGSKLLKRGADGRDLFRTRFGDLFWLDPKSYVDRCIIDSGVFEEQSTEVVRKLVKPGDTVLDVGANIGYYAVLLAKLVGPSGRVICFEPTSHFRGILERNIEANQLRNVEVAPIGLSDSRQRREIAVFDSSATLHAPGADGLRSTETIELTTLDEFARDRGLERIDFIKVDVDGHEPSFLNGAWSTIAKTQAVVLAEISHLHYLQAGVTAWDFFDSVRARGFHVYHEDGMVELTDTATFLVKCGNFAYSANIILSQRRLGS